MESRGGGDYIRSQSVSRSPVDSELADHECRFSPQRRNLSGPRLRRCDGQRTAGQREWIRRCQAVDGVDSRIVLDRVAAEVDRHVVRRAGQDVVRPVQRIAPMDAITAAVPSDGGEECATFQPLGHDGEIVRHTTG